MQKISKLLLLLSCFALLAAFSSAVASDAQQNTLVVRYAFIVAEPKPDSHCDYDRDFKNLSYGNVKQAVPRDKIKTKDMFAALWPGYNFEVLEYGSKECVPAQYYVIEHNVTGIDVSVDTSESVISKLKAAWEQNLKPAISLQFKVFSPVSDPYGSTNKKDCFNVEWIGGYAYSERAQHRKGVDYGIRPGQLRALLTADPMGPRGKMYAVVYSIEVI